MADECNARSDPPRRDRLPAYISARTLSRVRAGCVPAFLRVAPCARTLPLQYSQLGAYLHRPIQSHTPHSPPTTHRPGMANPQNRRSLLRLPVPVPRSGEIAGLGYALSCPPARSGTLPLPFLQHLSCPARTPWPALRRSRRNTRKLAPSAPNVTRNRHGPDASRVRASPLLACRPKRAHHRRYPRFVSSFPNSTPDADALRCGH